ncbi:uncharacterized protein LY79DRAFT_571391 [Colletotrichum navitas]|uniref:Uncharacterized protein n=1 Tax=Colletotrichum navitas TaxID=681940 RepID=A0AAD8PLE1_9PEZI|nr:uncharacterized protein LY79DRAFT_571391 [Colletotrichum navitas]KAK1569706.1 hypothetical protein LY79DRAFT_571391 [Colletotrichum navitas]
MGRYRSNPPTQRLSNEWHLHSRTTRALKPSSLLLLPFSSLSTSLKRHTRPVSIQMPLPRPFFPCSLVCPFPLPRGPCSPHTSSTVRAVVRAYYYYILSPSSSSNWLLITRQQPTQSRRAADRSTCQTTTLPSNRVPGAPPNPCLDRFIGPAVLPGCFTTAFLFLRYPWRETGKKDPPPPTYPFVLVVVVVVVKHVCTPNPSPANAVRTRKTLALVISMHDEHTRPSSWLPAGKGDSHLLLSPSAGEPPCLAEPIPEDATTASSEPARESRGGWL